MGVVLASVCVSAAIWVPNSKITKNMEEHENAGEQITRHLLAGENLYAEGIGIEQNCAVDGEVKQGDYISPVTGVLLLSTFIAVCGSLNYGLAVGYSSPVESEIIGDLGLSVAEYSLFGSFLTIGGALGATTCGKLSDYLGRRGIFGVTDVFSIAGWITIVLSQDAMSLYLGRLQLGLALGLSAYVVPVYVAEITPKDLRGRFVIFNTLMLAAGLSIAYILGLFISWRALAAIGIIPNLSQLIGLFFIPESPRWLVKVGKEKEFEAALQRLNGASTNISGVAADIRDYTRALEQSSKVSIFQLFQRKYAYTLTVGIGLIALSQLDGLNGITYYASSIFESAGLSSKFGSIMMAFIKVLSVSIAIPLVDKCGRRPLLLMYSGFYVIGMGISFLLISEIYPINIKGLAGSVATLVGWVSSAFVTYTFNFSMEWSSSGTFFVLAGICAFTVLFVAILVPETKGRTLEEMQASINQMFGGDRDQG